MILLSSWSQPWSLWHHLTGDKDPSVSSEGVTWVPVRPLAHPRDEHWSWHLTMPPPRRADSIASISWLLRTMIGSADAITTSSWTWPGWVGDAAEASWAVLNALAVDTITDLIWWNEAQVPAMTQVSLQLISLRSLTDGWSDGWRELKKNMPTRWPLADSRGSPGSHVMMMKVGLFLQIDSREAIRASQLTRMPRFTLRIAGPAKYEKKTAEECIEQDIWHDSLDTLRECCESRWLISSWFLSWSSEPWWTTWRRRWTAESSWIESPWRSLPRRGGVRILLILLKACLNLRRSSAWASKLLKENEREDWQASPASMSMMLRLTEPVVNT